MEFLGKLKMIADLVYKFILHSALSGITWIYYRLNNMDSIYYLN